ncbi:hypothetical protein H2200_003007 [Cladophialophora chaetospira]|uniref:Heterokaryon incompatibility domain-containing protein n=1 Tax=Cladophialophora chaetospira TaxID=386627 RepID=A0AA38XH87_9EURO|nr:hypothetical protein H2200_003007 [Cladophialophora chaetospira]
MSNAFDEPLPRRLLQITDDRVVLREDPAQKRHPYACLSHCWGNSPRHPQSVVLKTKRSTLAQFKVEVPWNELTKTFKDAVDVCRWLNIEYLWIDSLCILQDSVDDWSQSATEVGSIYENALLTIAATKSKEGREGCYSTPNGQHLAHLVTETDNVYVRRKPPSYPVHDLSLDMENFPLLDRSWVYQEMHLSSRVLHFCFQEVIWSCRAMRRSQSGISDEEATTEFENSTDLHGWDPSWKDLERQRNPDNFDEVRTLWYRIVEEYTRLHISFPSDIFPALAALTQRMYGLRSDGDVFMAGLWRKTLLLDMMWRSPTGIAFERPRRWRAPTWSWASVQTQVIWDPRLDSVFDAVELHEVNCETQGPPELGSLNARGEATVVLHAPLIKATWQRAWARSRNPELILDEIEGRLDTNRYFPDYDYDLPGEHHIPWNSSLHLLPMAIAWIPLENNYQGRRDGAGGYRHVGLGLRELEKSDSGPSSPALYERIGYVEIVEDHAQANMTVDEAREAFERVDSILRSLPRLRLTLV